MASYSGKFEYRNTQGGVIAQGSCQLHLDAEVCTVTPASGTPITFDLGDVDALQPGEWDALLRLYTGFVLQLKQFGTSFGTMSGELVAAWRDRTLQCLLLEDLEEVGRFSGAVSGGAEAPTPAEVRVFKSNVAVLPMEGLPSQWRLADVAELGWNSETYQAVFESTEGDLLKISRLAKKSEEFMAKVNETLSALRTKAAEALHSVFPFLNPEQLGKLQRAMPEGHSAKLATLREIHPRLVDALVEQAVDDALRPYFEELRKRGVEESIAAGWKFLRAEEGEEAGPDAQPFFFWFFFPLRGTDLVAWEATTGSGRATYFFRVNRETATDKQIARWTRALALINFRREPIYLSDEALNGTAKFHRYAIAARKLSDLRSLRAAYVGRAIHSSPEEWAKQIPSV